MPPCDQPMLSEGLPACPGACKRGPGVDALHLFRSCVARAPAVAGSVPDLPTADELSLRYRTTVRELGLCLALLQVPGGQQEAATLDKMEALIDRHLLTLTALALAGRQDVIRQFAATDCESQENTTCGCDGSHAAPPRCMLAAAAVQELQLTQQQDTAIARSMRALLDAERGRRSSSSSLSAPLTGAEAAQMRAFMADDHMLSAVDVLGCLSRPQVALLMLHSWPLPVSMADVKRALVMRWTQQLRQRSMVQ